MKALAPRGQIDFIAKIRENIDGMANLVPKEKGPNTLSSVDKTKLTVLQPQPLKELTKLLESFDALPQRISERTGEDTSSDLGSSGAAVTGTRNTGTSPRDQAIAAMPAEPLVLRTQLAKHIEKEVHDLQKLARSAASASRPGDAFHLNQIYARIRRLNALLVELWGTTVEVLRRLYIRVFVDKQPIL